MYNDFTISSSFDHLLDFIFSVGVVSSNNRAKTRGLVTEIMVKHQL